MKQFKLAVMALFALVIVSNVNAQDKNNPWAVSFGANIVDFYQPGSISGQFDDFVGSSSDWNILPSVTRVSLEKYIEKGFSLQLSGSFNKITSLNTVDDSDFLYYSVDAIVKYDLNDLVGETSWFDPFVYIGGGYATANDQGEGILNVGLGFNTWFNENLGINFQTGSKSGFTDKVAAHLQTSLGLVIKFGGTDKTRAWKARSLGPGSFRDSSVVFDKIGEVLLEGNMEYRFDLLGFLDGALFVDAGNIWNALDNIEDPKQRFDGFEDLNEIAIGTGFGLRYDYD